jgi:phenol hydroxylase P0 protein
MAEVNANKRWVRVMRETESGFVEFEFYVSDQDLFVDLILPTAAFRDFCVSNGVDILHQDAACALAGIPSSGLLKRVK